MAAIGSRVSTRNSESERELTTARFETIDIFKGILVVLMAVYHAVVVLKESSGALYVNVIQHLMFLHSAFLFITGFLIGSYYRPRVIGGRRDVPMRLFRRGVKILTVFVVCNILIICAGLGPSRAELAKGLIGIEPLFTNLIKSVSGTLFSFEILAYIGLFLMLSSVTVHDRMALITCAFIVLLCSVHEMYRSKTVLFLAVAYSGQWIGVLGQRLWSRYRIMRFGITTKISAGILLMATRPLFLYAYQLVSGAGKVPLLVVDTLIWWVGSASVIYLINWDGLAKALRILGKHTLVAYVFQMPLVKVCSVILHYYQWSDVMGYLVSCGLIVVFTYCVVVIAELLANRLSAAKRAVV